MTSTNVTASDATLGENPAVAKMHASMLTMSEAKLFQRQLLNAVTSQSTHDDLMAEILKTVALVAPTRWIGYFGRDEAGKLAACFEQSTSEATLSQSVRNEVAAAVGMACARGEVVVGKSHSDGNLAIVASPVVLRGQLPEAICGVWPSGEEEHVALTLLVQLACSTVTMWHVLYGGSLAEKEADASAALVEILDILHRSESPVHASYCLVDQLQAHLGLECRVAIGLRRAKQGPCRLRAISGVSKFDRRSELSRSIEGAMDEAILRDEFTIWPCSDDSQRHATLAHQHVSKVAQAESIVTLPLGQMGESAAGAITILGPLDFVEQTDHLDFLRASAPAIESCLTVLERSKPGPIRRLASSLLPENGYWRRLVVSSVAGLLVLGMFVPMPYKIGCDCELQPVHRRFVSAPYDGILANAPVEPGDLVSKGTVLARMEDREIRLELSGLDAQYAQANKQRDTALAKGDYAGAQQAKYEMERLELKRNLLRHRAENLDLKSPIEGIVIAGDWKKAERAPLSMGQSLFEVAPLEEMVVEVAIPEEDLNHVHTGQSVEVRIHAQPWNKFNGSVKRIRPRAEVRENQNVFIAEVLLDNRLGELRPGMKGKAKIISTSHSLGWILFHKPFEAARRLL